MKIAITLMSCWMAAAGASTVAQTASPAAAEGPAVPGALPATDASVAPAQSVAVSQVRIVRLSQVSGEVQMDRKTDRRFEQAFVNLPIVAGAALRTRRGVAEVEFEDNSSLRLTPESKLAFTRLGREAAGATFTVVDLVHGSLYVSLAGGKSTGDFTVKAGNESIVLSPSSHLRLDLDAPTAKMFVFQGTATVTGPSGSLIVTRKKAISFDTASSAAPEFIRMGEASAYDSWDKNAVDYHKARTVAAGFAGSPYAYGVSDLSYYGSFSDVGGCGTMWRPHLASAAWDPYSSGVWSYYPGQGYSWVSLYPWGWTPFHSGSWNYCPAGGGWGWNPQGNWNGLLNHPATKTIQGPSHGPVRPEPPTHVPISGQPTMIAVNVTSLHPSGQAEDGKFIFRADSAGLGVPRGVFNNLAKMSQRVETRGSATAYISEHQAAVAFTAPSRPASGALSSVATGHSSTAHTGTAPSGTTSSSGFTRSNSISTGAGPSSVSSGASPSSGAAPVSHH